jgi:D-alanyl-D-alanine dipeptidase
MKIRFFIQLLLIILLTSCSGNDQSSMKSSVYKKTLLVHKSLEVNKKKKITSQILLNQGDTLVPVDYFNSAIYWELKYATTDNFMHRKLYDTLKKPFIQLAIARKLAKCQQYLASINPDYHLLIYDALRPLSVQWEMWNALDTIPVTDRVKFVSNPANGSIHNYGAAVDITICSNNKTPLDMGAGYDDIRKIAYPSLENEFLKSGELTVDHISNRQLLRKVMQQQNFRNIPTEWWHFNADSRSIIKLKYHLITSEISQATNKH